MIDRSGETALWSKSAETIFGYTADEVRGKNLHTLPDMQNALTLEARAFCKGDM